MLKQKEEVSAEGILFDKKVRLVPVTRKGAMIEDPEHVGFWKYDGTQVNFVLPKSISKRTLYPLLNDEETKFFESKLGVDLNPYSKSDNFWHTFRLVVQIDPSFKKNGLLLDLSDVMDNLKWRLLRIQENVAPTWEDRYEKGSYDFALVDEDHERSDRVKSAVTREKAYKFLSSISYSSDKLYSFLFIYFLQNPKSKRPAADGGREDYYADAELLISNDIKGFMAVAEDPEYEMKLMIHKAIMNGSVDKKFTTKEYFTPEGKFLGNNLDEVIHNLRTPAYQEDLMRIKAVTDAINDEPVKKLKKKE